MDINSSLKQNFDQARNALDLNGLNDIRQQSRSGDGEAKKEALTEAAQQFEAIFMKMLLASMRKAQEVLESDSPFNSQSTKFYRDMHDQQMAVELSSNGSLGLTDLIVRQLGGDSGKFKPSSVLRNDGNLTVKDSITSSDDKGSKANRDSQHNSLIEKMLSDKNQIKPDIDIPFSGNYQAHSSMTNPFHSVMNSLSNKEINKDLENKINKTNAHSQSVNISAPLSVKSFSEPKDFVSALIEPAQKVQQILGVPFEVVIAQAALETGWGQKIIN
jgi:flagellar protein FlgJ